MPDIPPASGTGGCLACTDHTVTGCFARTWDDSLVIKNYSGSSKGITFRDCQIWTDLAQSMEIGLC